MLVNEHIAQYGKNLTIHCLVGHFEIIDLNSKGLITFNNLNKDIDYMNDYTVDGYSLNHKNFVKDNLGKLEVLTDEQIDNIRFRFKEEHRVLELDKPVYFLGTRFKSEIEHVVGYNSRASTAITVKSQSFKDVAFISCLWHNSHYGDLKFFDNNFWNSSKPKNHVCPECKNTGKVTLFQFVYRCSLCSNGERL